MGLRLFAALLRLASRVPLFGLHTCSGHLRLTGGGVMCLYLDGGGSSTRIFVPEISVLLREVNFLFNVITFLIPIAIMLLGTLEKINLVLPKFSHHKKKSKKVRERRKWPRSQNAEKKIIKMWRNERAVSEICIKNYHLYHTVQDYRSWKFWTGLWNEETIQIFRAKYLCFSTFYPGEKKWDCWSCKCVSTQCHRQIFCKKRGLWKLDWSKKVVCDLRKWWKHIRNSISIFTNIHKSSKIFLTPSQKKT